MRLLDYNYFHSDLNCTKRHCCTSTSILCPSYFAVQWTACSPLNSEFEQQESESDAPETEDEDRFFNLHHSSASASDNNQCLAYLSDPDRNIEVLSRYPKIRSVFIKYNTALPSSAAVERLFSSASIILCKRRNRLSDETFEKLLLLRQNKHLVH